MAFRLAGYVRPGRAGGDSRCGCATSDDDYLRQGTTAIDNEIHQATSLFDCLERFQHQFELTTATGASFQVLSHALKHSVDRRAIEDALRVLVQFIKAFRAGQLDFSGLSDHREEPADLFTV